MIGQSPSSTGDEPFCGIGRLDQSPDRGLASDDPTELPLHFRADSFQRIGRLFAHLGPSDSDVDNVLESAGGYWMAMGMLRFCSPMLAPKLLWMPVVRRPMAMPTKDSDAR